MGRGEWVMVRVSGWVGVRVSDMRSMRESSCTHDTRKIKGHLYEQRERDDNNVREWTEVKGYK